MKRCTVCGGLRPLNEFYFRHKATSELHSQCKSCYKVRRKKTWRDYYNQKGSAYRKNAIERNKRTKRSLQNQLLQYLRDKACVHCGNSDIRVLEFDHINPSQKSFGIAAAITSRKSWPVILGEISKCQILCANCHKIKTAEERGWYKKLGKRTLAEA